MSADGKEVVLALRQPRGLDIDHLSAGSQRYRLPRFLSGPNRAHRQRCGRHLTGHRPRQLAHRLKSAPFEPKSAAQPVCG